MRFIGAMKTPHIILLAILLVASCVCHGEDAPSLPPNDYSILHISASNPRDPKWAESLQRLAVVGDDFTLEYLKVLDPKKLDPRQALILSTTLSATRERLAKENAQAFSKSIQTRLERAAWADLSCNP